MGRLSSVNVMGQRRKEGRARRSALEITVQATPEDRSTGVRDVSAEERLRPGADTGVPGQEEPSPAPEAEQTWHPPAGLLLPGPGGPGRTRAAGCWVAATEGAGSFQLHGAREKGQSARVLEEPAFGTPGSWHPSCRHSCKRHL